MWRSHLQNTYSLYPALLPPSWGAQPADYYTGGYSAAAPPLCLPPFTCTHADKRSSTMNQSSLLSWVDLKLYFLLVQIEREGERTRAHQLWCKHLFVTWHKSSQYNISPRNIVTWSFNLQPPQASPKSDQKNLRMI